MNMNIGGGTETVPLISVNAVIDSDIGVIKYILKNIGPNINFDYSKLKELTYTELLGKLYRRKDKNPLSIIASDCADNDLLDRVYNELLTEHEYEILDNSVYTEMVPLINIFKNSGINAIIFYYTEDEYSILKTIPLLKNTEIMCFDSIKKNKIKYDQLYLKYISELDKFIPISNTTIYLSTSGINLNEENNDINMNNNIIYDIVKYNNRINLYDIYKTDVIGRY